MPPEIKLLSDRTFHTKNTHTFNSQIISKVFHSHLKLVVVMMLTIILFWPVLGWKREWERGRCLCGVLTVIWVTGGMSVVSIPIALVMVVLM